MSAISKRGQPGAQAPTIEMICSTEVALALPRALETRDPARAREVLAAEPEIDTEYVDVLDDGNVRVLAAAIRVGSTRLIDNIPLEGGHR